MPTLNLKNAFPFLFFFVFLQTTHAQFGKGFTNLGGEFALDKYSVKPLNSSATIFSLNPSYGRFVTDRILISGRLSTAIHDYSKYDEDYFIIKFKKK